MTDRELLELAAKAAGVPGRWVEQHPEDGHPAYRCGIGNAGWSTPLWNPLTDDGDALRLAVKLMLSLVIGPCQVRASSIQGALRGEFPVEDAVYQDMAVATRRAIVRAAAEIGKAMP